MVENVVYVEIFVCRAEFIVGDVFGVVSKLWLNFSFPYDESQALYGIIQGRSVHKRLHGVDSLVHRRMLNTAPGKGSQCDWCLCGRRRDGEIPQKAE